MNHTFSLKKYLKLKRVRISILIFILLASLLTIFIIPARLIKKSQDYSYALYDKNHILLGAQVAGDQQWRFEPGQVPDKFKKCIIQFEDKRFYFHSGIDFFSIFRAVKSNVQEKRIVSGGSTITMQTIRILEGSKKRNYRQKIKEAFIAVIFEIRFTKKHILELYCANAPFGGNVVGLEAASWRYFNLPPEELTWAEAAVLAVLPNQPSLVYPGANSEILLRKRNFLLKKLYDKHYFDLQTYELSIAEELPGKPYPLASIAPHYLEYLKANNKDKTKFYTDLDFYLQKNCSRILEQWSLKFSRQGINNAAAIIMDTKSEKILAYCGNTGFDGRNNTSAAVDIIQSERSSGSLLKPFLYAAMLDAGELLPDQLVIDVPTRIGSYRPENNIQKYSGVVPASEALTRSLNIPAIRELQKYGINRFLDILKKCGFTTFNRSSDDYGLPLILGGGEIKMIEAARAYARLMQKANYMDIDFPISTGSAWLTVNVLATGTRPDDEANWQKYANSKKIAWKTGTSNGNRDAWAVGITNEYTVAVWIGNASGQGTPDLKSVSTSAPVLFDIFSILPKTSWPDIPYDDLVYQTVCSHSGYAAGQYCNERKEILRPKQASASQLCPYCKRISLTPDGKFQASADDLTGEKAGKYNGTFPKLENRFVLPPNLEYWYKNTSVKYRPLPEFVQWHNNTNNDNFSIIFPDPGARIIIPVEIDGNPGAMVAQAAVRSLDSILYWDLDGTYLCQTNNKHEIIINPEYGEHILTVTDNYGNVKRRKFTIMEK